MRIVILDGYTLNPGDLDWGGFERLGDCTVYDRTPFDSNETILNRIGDASAVLVNRTPIGRAVMDRAPNLSYIGLFSSDMSAIDLSAAKDRGITVTAVDGYGGSADAEMTFALLFELSYRIGRHNDSVQNGDWENCEDDFYWLTTPMELFERTIGVIGNGDAAQMVKRAAAAFGMHVLLFDPEKESETDSTEPDAGRTDFDTLLRKSDIVTLCCAATERTAALINKDAIRRMKQGAILINNADGSLIVEKDLAEALDEGKIAAAALDVVSKLPIAQNNPLLHRKNCLLTPRITFAAKAVRERVLSAAVAHLEQHINAKEQAAIK